MSRQPSASAAIGWTLLSLIGFGAALSLVVAGQSVGYQHYLSLAQLPSKPISVGILGLQALLVIFALRSELGSLSARLTALLPAWRLPVFLLAMFGTSAIVGRDLPKFVVELCLSSLVQLIAVATTWLAVRAIPFGALHRFRALFERVLGPDVPFGDDIAPRIDRFAWRTAFTVFVVCALLAVFVYQRHPHLQDEVAYLLQARTFASGRVALPNPPVPSAFELYLIASSVHGWYSPVPPGLGVAFVPGVWLGATWLVNPLFTAANVVLLYLVLQPLYGRRVARLSTLLFATSPWNLFLGMTFMPHAVTLFLALAATLGVIATRRTGLARWTWLGGLALGVLATVRQLDAMVMAGALGLWAIGLGGRRLKWSGTAGLVLGAMLGAAPLLAFNRHFTGSVGTFPIMAYNDALYGKGANDYGFGANRGMGWPLDPNPGHGPLDGTINASLNTAATQVELFGWAIGSLVLVYAFVLRGRLSRSDRGMLGIIAFTWLAYFFNYFAGGPDFGGRYWFLMIVPLVALTARGALTLGSPRDGPVGTIASSSAAGAPAPDRVVQAMGTESFTETRWLTGLALAVVGGLVVFMPWRAVDKYWHYRGMRPDIVKLATEAHFGDGLIVVSGRELPDYASAATYNPLSLRDRVPVYVRHTTASSDSAAVVAFPDRAVWLVDGPTISGTGYVVRAGPLSTSDALRRIATLATVPAPPAGRQ